MLLPQHGRSAGLMALSTATAMAPAATAMAYCRSHGTPIHTCASADRWDRTAHAQLTADGGLDMWERGLKQNTGRKERSIQPSVLHLALWQGGQAAVISRCPPLGGPAGQAECRLQPQQRCRSLARWLLTGPNSPMLLPANAVDATASAVPSQTAPLQCWQK